MGAAYECGRVRLFHGDCREVMAGMGVESVDAIVTDPPYGLQFMGRGWDHAVPGVAFWTEALRVAKPGAHLLAFGGTRTFHRLACAIEDAGWEIRDTVMWLYGAGFPKSHTALKPAWEPILLARKPLEGTVAANVQKHGTGGINVDACRVGSGHDKGEWPITKRRHNDGTWTVQPVATDKTIGRWPANLIHDGSDEVLSGFPTTTSGSRAEGVHTIAGGRGRFGTFKKGVLPALSGSSGSAARFFYTAKASADERDGSGHPTVKPLALMRYLVRLVTPPGGVVLDPFCGTGSTGVACIREGCGFVGIEQDATHVGDAERRLVEAGRQGTLWSGFPYQGGDPHDRT